MERRQNSFRQLSHVVKFAVANISRQTDKTIMSEYLEKLIEAARNREMSQAEKEAQRRSFAYGNAHIENDLVTREMIEKAADRLDSSRS